jgi:hypothetical protein
MITGKTPILRVLLNGSTGTTDTTTRRSYQMDGTASVVIVEKFQNVQTAENYLYKYHNAHDGIIEYKFETNITDSTFVPVMDQRFCGKHFVGSGANRKWTIGDLTALPIAQLRHSLYIQDMYICVNGNSGNASHMFEVFDGGYTLILNGCAFETGTNVKFGSALFYNFGNAFYNEANPLEIKNDLVAGDYQILHRLGEGALAYVKNEVIFSGQWSTASFGNGGGSFQFAHTNNYGGINAATRGPFIMESGYTLPSQYASNGVPAFAFEAGQAQVFHDHDSITTDVMRYSTVLGAAERYDKHVLTTSIASLSHTGVETFERNLIMYPHGANGSQPSHTNYRGWVFWGVTPSNQMPAKKSFQII